MTGPGRHASPGASRAVSAGTHPSPSHHRQCEARASTARPQVPGVRSHPSRPTLAVAVALLAVKLGGIGDFDNDHYVLKALFTSTSGLKVGSDVEVAGVVVGKVKRISLDPEEYESVVEISLPNAVEVQEDAIASVRSTGLIGGKFIKISPGGADELLQVGDEIAVGHIAVEQIRRVGFGGVEDAAPATDAVAADRGFVRQVVV